MSTNNRQIEAKENQITSKERQITADKEKDASKERQIAIDKQYHLERGEITTPTISFHLFSFIKLSSVSCSHPFWSQLASKSPCVKCGRICLDRRCNIRRLVSSLDLAQPVYNDLPRRIRRTIPARPSHRDLCSRFERTRRVPRQVWTRTVVWKCIQEKLSPVSRWRWRRIWPTHLYVTDSG